MNLSCLLPLLREGSTYRQLVEQLRTTGGEHRAIVLDAAKPYFIATLYEEFNLPVIVITAQPEGARKLYEQLQVWCPPSANLHFWSHETDAVVERLQTLATLALYESSASCRSEYNEESHYAQDRLRRESGDPMAGMNPATTFGVTEQDSSVAMLPQNDKKMKGAGVEVKRPPLIVASALATISRTIPRRDFVSACHTLEQGMTIDPLELLRRWQNMGYEMEDIVEVPGVMSRRGGIIDVFPPCSQLPARIEFFGNQIESMRFFNPESQCSTKPVSSLTIIPAKEVLNIGSILDYLNDDALPVLDAPEEIKIAVERIDKEAGELREVKLGDGELPQDFPSSCLTWEELQSKVSVRQHLALESWDITDNDGQVLPFTPSQSYGGRLEGFLKEAKQAIKQRQRLFIVSHQANRLAELLQDEGIHVSPSSQIEQIPPRGSITVLQGSLAEGWEMTDRLSLLTDAELFGFVKQARLSRRTPIRRQWLLPQLRPGDYVVHIDHGIGKFNGLTRMSTDGNEREYLILEYAAGDRLYVPTDQIERISRYIGAGEQAPTLSRLGTQEWERTKKRVKQSVADIAQGLLDLYAAREVTTGFAFSPDTSWQQELEASFPYMETPDQLEAITAVKEGMEKAKPLDRLICGDVGYGKTEVALRAVFKAVMDNKQVAILVPTTILAQQHLVTFKSRLAVFPLKVEMLSRFCSRAREQEIIEGLADGTVDICIGTHRLLQNDIAFKDLGLVIIDEEQQFGVEQKEKLKEMWREVDVLTLSATPIPRTLHMSLTGIRDMNIMETPPEERLSIKTYVGVYNDTLVRQAVLRELDRNGQVFFVHNRVQSIALVASKLQSLVPEARIAVAHGQMPEEELGKVMIDFIAGKSDVLVSTTIIQLGLDMPNVNTLIVDQADKFGLTQLYQLRGRIGRGINQAYAYFLFDKGKQLTTQAHKRLRAIFEATELGAGFGIAMRDLEIRGAGNLLGVKQSGHIAAIGFDLYCQLLAEAIEELKTKQLGYEHPPVIASEVKQSPSIGLPLTAYIPEDYVPNLNTRLSLYRRLAKVDHVEAIEDIAQEFRDRFGVLPQPVRNLLYGVKAKVMATKAEVSSISTEGRQVIIKTGEGVVAIAVKQSLSEHYHGAIKVGATQIRLDTKYPGINWTEILEEVLRSIVESAPNGARNLAQRLPRHYSSSQ
jgi:transcription-repair coupling factor (superfamily II helicase)